MIWWWLYLYFEKFSVQFKIPQQLPNETDGSGTGIFAADPALVSANYISVNTKYERF